MAWNKFGPRTAFALGKALQKHTGVAELIASENNFGDSGGLSLAFALCVNKSIGNLELQRCGLGPNAAIAFADALRLSPSIVKLDLSDNPIGPKSATNLVSAVAFVSQKQKAKIEERALNMLAEQRKRQEPDKETVNASDIRGKKSGETAGGSKKTYKMKIEKNMS